MSQIEGEDTSKKRVVSFLCDCLGITRQGYYAHAERNAEIEVLRTSIVMYCQEVLSTQLPKAGMRELYAKCQQRFGDKLTIGRDQCYEIFRANGLVQRHKKRPRTTNSNHHFHIYPDMLNVAPKLVAVWFGHLVVADITYVPTNEGWAYLSLLTDAASRMIVGWSLQKSLATDGPMEALQMALGKYKEMGVDMEKLIHHSDRGVQYCSNAYVEELKANKVNISMTQTGDPLHNAMAERVNNTIKNGWLFDCDDCDFEEVKRRVEHGILMYNTERPHMAIGMLTPEKMMQKLVA